jgi:branched-chain amino acid transport system substrate-binding protein
MTNDGKSERKLSRIDRRTFLRTTGGAATLAALAGCAEQSGGDGGDGGDGGSDGSDGGSDGGSSTGSGSGSGGGGDGPITIASLQPFSGPFTPWGQAHSAGLDFAVQQINNNGGVLGRDLEISEGDTGSDPGEADSLFRQTVEQDDAVAAVGPVSSDVGIRTRATAEELQVPLILHMAGSHRILPKDVRYAFRLGSHSAVTDMTSVIGMIEEEGFTEVGAIIGDYEWGRSVETTIGSLLPDSINLSMEVAPVQTDDFTPFLRNIPEDIGVLLASGHPPGSISIHSQANELGMQNEYTVGAGFPPGVLRNALGDLSASFAHQHVADPYSDQFVQVATSYAEDRGERFDTHHAYGYASAQILATAIEEAGSADPSAISDAMRSTEFDTLLARPINYVDYGEVEGLVHMLSTFEDGAPEYYPDGDWRLTELYRSDPLPAFDPDEWNFDS